MRRFPRANPLPAPGRKKIPWYGLSGLCVLLACILLAGCMDEALPAGEKPSPPGVLIEYSRTGGIAGFSDYMVVFSDGWVVYNSTHHGTGGFSLENRDVDLLRGLIRDANIPSLKDEYPAPVQGADYITYVIVVGNRTITMETTGVPAQMVPVITTMDDLLSSHGSAP